MTTNTKILPRNITVATVRDAWSLANIIFPTDYKHDIPRTCRAGYNIFYSTAEGVTAYICDLKSRLELNLPQNETVNIWIKEV